MIKVLLSVFQSEKRETRKKTKDAEERTRKYCVCTRRETDRVRQTESDRQIDRERDWESWGRGGGGGGGGLFVGCLLNVPATG